MITTLSYTIYGNKRRIEKAARHWMSQMGRIMDKDINGMTLLELRRDDSKLNYKQFTKRQIAQMFKPTRTK